MWQPESFEQIPYGDPPSPWLERYGGTHDPELRKAGRSGLAPVLPDLTPFGVDLNYQNQLVLARPSAPDLDFLLRTENIQLSENKGWKSWQVGAFAEGQSAEFNDPITVDPNRWHPLLRRERWYDLQVPLFPGELDKGIMSIDNPVVWKDISVVLELANRMFNMLVNSGFYDPILSGAPFSEVQCFSKDEKYGESTPLCARQSNITEPVEVARLKVTRRLVQLAPHLIITWFQDHSPTGNNKLAQFGMRDAYERSRPPWGATQFKWSEDRDWRCLIRLSASVFRTMAQCDETTLNGRAEKSLLTYFYAKVVFHELAHAVWRLHMWTGLPEGQGEPLKLGLEVALENDYVAELGMAAEQAAFGGATAMIPFAQQTYCTHTHQSCYMLHLSHFPSNAGRFAGSPVSFGFNDQGSWPFPRVDLSHAIPASFATNLLSETFWRTKCWDQMGMAALQPLRVFTAVEDSGNYERDVYYSNIFDQDMVRSLEARKWAGLVPDLSQMIDVEGRCLHVFECLSARTLLYNRMRPWYHQEMCHWTLTPYSHEELRLALASFNLAVTNRDEGQAISAVKHALYLLESPLPNRMHIFVRSYYAIVAKAMAVTTPWSVARDEVELPLAVESFMIPNLWQPSAAARNAAEPFAFKEQFKCKNEAVSFTRGGFIPPQIAVLPPREGRLFLLRQANTDLQTMAKDGGLHSTLYNMTNNELLRLTQEVTSNEANYTDWLSSFAIILPEYEFQEIITPTVPTVQQQDPTPTPTTINPALLRSQAPPAQPMSQLVAPPDAGPLQGDFQDAFMGFDSGGDDGGMGAFMARPVSSVERPVRKTYWSAGEVGDHAGENGDEKWVLVEDEETGGYDVYDVSTLSLVQGALQVDFKYGVLVTDDGAVGRIRALDGEEREGGGKGLLRGRLLLPRTKQEIAENNGRLGRPKWVLAGSYVYDITDFPAKHDDEHEFLWSAPDGDVLLVVMTDGPGHHDMDDLEHRLYPFRCATLRLPEPSVNRTLLMPYSLREVNLHMFPQVRALTSVDGWVYDITDFADTSPLGRRKVLSLAAREVGTHVRSLAAGWAERFLHDVEPYKIGWVVPERELDDARLELQEVLIRGYVYSIGGLLENAKTKEDADLGKALLYLGVGGTDASEQLAKHQQLVQLTRRQDLVVAKLYSEPTYEVGEEDMDVHGPSSVSVPLLGVSVYSAQVAGELEEGEEDHDAGYVDIAPISTWARIGNKVYDVSNLVHYGDDATRTRILAYVGGAITDASLIHDLQQCGLCPVMGKFVGKAKKHDAKITALKAGVKRKRSAQASSRLRFKAPPMSSEELTRMRRQKGGCGCGQDMQDLEDMDEMMGMKTKPSLPVDAEHEARFGYVDADGMVGGKRLRLV